MTDDKPGKKQALIQATIKEWILSGRLHPGAHLPKRIELERQFSVSRVTIQRVFDQLTHDGFVVSNRRGGTVVANPLPHLSRYALVFPTGMDEWNHFWRALHQMASVIGDQPDRQIINFIDINARLHNKTYQQLVAEVEADRLAGLIFTFPPFALANSPIITYPGIPRVAIMNDPANLALPQVATEGTSFVRRALDHFAHLGRRKLAVLTISTFQLSDIIDNARQRGFVVRPEWVQGVPMDQPAWARNLMHLLFNVSNHERPDALLITDDNIVEHATAGLVASGIRVPDELAVVAHGNFPWLTPCAMPITRLGYDAGQVLASCMTVIDTLRRGEKPAPLTLIDAVFEHEHLIGSRV